MAAKWFPASVCPVKKGRDLSIVTSRVTFQKMRNAGYLRGSNKFDRYNPKVHAVTKKGAELLGFYQKLEREVM